VASDPEQAAVRTRRRGTARRAESRCTGRGYLPAKTVRDRENLGAFWLALWTRRGPLCTYRRGGNPETVAAEGETRMRAPEGNRRRLAKASGSGNGPTPNGDCLRVGRGESPPGGASRTEADGEGVGLGPLPSPASAGRARLTVARPTVRREPQGGFGFLGVSRVRDAPLESRS
jgi:hypothetical protein